MQIKPWAGIVIAALLHSACSLDFGGSLGSNGTPPPTPERGTLVQQTQHHEWTIAVRRYRAGKRADSQDFCDYHIRHRGRTVPVGHSGQAQNHYNHCQALQWVDARSLAATTEPALLLMAYESGRKWPYLLTVEAGRAVARRMDSLPGLSYAACQLPIDTALTGWPTRQGHIDVCGLRLPILPPLPPPPPQPPKDTP